MRTTRATCGKWGPARRTRPERSWKPRVPGCLDPFFRGSRGILAGLACIGATMAQPTLGEPTVYFVDWNQANDSGDGESWETAKKHLWAAIDLAGSGDIILVRGSGTPDTARYAPEGTDVSATFLINGLEIYGGFDPNDDTADTPEEAEPYTYISILTGDLEGTSNRAEHVVTASAYALLSGFTIEGGSAAVSSGTRERGAGVYVNGAGPEIVDCLIRNNLAAVQGGGMYINNGSPNVLWCMFEGNDAGQRGAGLYVNGGAPLIYHCDFLDNDAGTTTSNFLWNGGGVMLYHSGADLYDCEFKENSADWGGGGLAVEGAASNGSVLDCVFDGNEANSRGGAVFAASTNVNFDTCVFDGNTAPSGGGAYVSIFSTTTLGADIGPSFNDCTFNANTATTGSGGGAVTDTWLHPSEYATRDATAFTNCTFTNNVLRSGVNGALGAGIAIGGSTYLEACTFEGNGCYDGTSSEYEINGGGAAVNNYRRRGLGPNGTAPFEYNFHTAVLEDCVFRANTHKTGGTGHDYILHGGGLYIARPQTLFHAYCTPDEDGDCIPLWDPLEDPPDTSAVHYDAILSGCRFIDNLSANGGGLFLDRAAAQLIQCDLMGNQADGNSKNNNTASYGGGAISTYRLSYLNLTDCRFVNNRVAGSEFDDIVNNQPVNRSRSGGAIYVYLGMIADIDRCWFVGNRADSTQTGYGKGGAIWVNQHCRQSVCGEYPQPCICGDENFTATANVYNSLFVGNFAELNGGACYIEKGGRSRMVNCTVMHNRAVWFWGGVFSNSAIAAEDPWIEEACVNEVYNSILWANSSGLPSDPDGERLKNQLHDSEAEDESPFDGWPTAAHCDIRDGGTSPRGVYDGNNGNIGGHDEEHDPGIPVATAWGEWTAAAVYDAETGLTEFTASGLSAGALLGQVLRTVDEFTRPGYSLIVSNTTTEIYVLGDLSAFDYDDEFDDFVVYNYALTGVSSPCYNTGEDELYSIVSQLDILGHERFNETVDMGCYESQAIP